MKYTVKTVENQTEWDKFVTSHPDANFLQSWDFYEFYRSRGFDIVRRGIYDENDQLVGVYAGEVEPAKRGRHLAVAGGPIFDWTNQEVKKLIFDDMKLQAKKLKCTFVRVRPQLQNTPENAKTFQQLGFRKAPMYLSVEFAGVLNLENSEEEILKNMRQRLRRALRKAEKNQITIEKTSDPKAIHDFYQIELQTAKRHDFYAFSY